MLLFLRVLRALTSVTVIACVLATNLSLAYGEEGDIDAELLGYSTREEPLPQDEEWVDPIERFDLDPDTLTPIPEFDVSTLHDSTVFAAGVDQVAVDDQDLNAYIERHVRVLQAIDTLDRDIDSAALAISIRRPRVARLNNAITTEHQEEARLAEEIDIRQKAIAEFAIRAFIAEDELDTALSVPDTGLSETRVVTDEVRNDQLQQIIDREAELARRQARRADLEEDLRLVRSELRTLRGERTQLLEHGRVAEQLLTRTASSYKIALHDRLPQFVEGTDIPLVALNAYVIAARILAEERPACGIEWSMLAGIGKIESFHGHFGNSTLNVNGHTTEDITGPALDGRILEGAEFLVDGVAPPEATGRTEALEVPVAADAAAGVENVAGDAAGTVVAAPVPVIKRLALIKDSDGGRLDGDTTYDRAVGPMQFIPQTWRLFEADANGDENSDPQNIYDAALASARYLCGATGSMRTLDGQKQAYFAYNHDEEYTANVFAAGDYYRRRIDLPDEPFGAASPLGTASPELRTITGKAAESVKTFDDDTLLDW